MYVNISGASISGLSAAITLAQGGLKVIVHEKRRTIGANFSETVHSVRNYGHHLELDVKDYVTNILQLDVGNSFIPIFKFERTSPNLKSYISINYNRPVLYNVLRGRTEKTLDSYLYNQALKLGVKFDFNTKFESSKSDIIATGAPSADFVGYGKHFHNLDFKEFDTTKVFFSNDFAPKGYGYIVPFGKDKTTVAVFCSKSHMKLSSKEYYSMFETFLNKHSILTTNKTEAVSIDAGIGYYNSYKTLQVNNKLYVGTAGGLMTADYGFALLFALSSGNFAAKAILTNTNYDKLIKKEIYPYLYSSVLKRYKMNKYNNNDYDSLITKKLENSKDTRYVSVNHEFKTSLTLTQLLFAKYLLLKKSKTKLI